MAGKHKQRFYRTKLFTYYIAAIVIIIFLLSPVPQSIYFAVFAPFFQQDKQMPQNITPDKKPPLANTTKDAGGDIGTEEGDSGDGDSSSVVLPSQDDSVCPQFRGIKILWLSNGVIGIVESGQQVDGYSPTGDVRCSLQESPQGNIFHCDITATKQSTGQKKQITSTFTVDGQYLNSTCE